MEGCHRGGDKLLHLGLSYLTIFLLTIFLSLLTAEVMLHLRERKHFGWLRYFG